MVVQSNHRGLHEWIVQRLSAIVIGIYAIFLLAYLIIYQPLYYAQWHELFQNLLMKIATFIVLLAMIWHAWIGIWTVFTDYVKNIAVRYTLQTLVILLLLGYLVWCIEILWG